MIVIKKLFSTFLASFDMEQLLLSRADAAKILGVSTRTIDRHIARNQFSVVRDNGKVFLRQDEVENFRNEQNPIVAQVVNETALSTNTNGEMEEEVKKFKILYEEAKEEISHKDELINQMHYTLGVLETQIKSSVPLLEAQNAQEEIQKNNQHISEENAVLKTQLTKAKISRTFFFFLTLSLFLALVGIFLLQSLGYTLKV